MAEHSYGANKIAVYLPYLTCELRDSFHAKKRYLDRRHMRRAVGREVNNVTASLLVPLAFR